MSTHFILTMISNSQGGTICQYEEWYNLFFTTMHCGSARDYVTKWDIIKQSIKIRLKEMSAVINAV